jgi:hypothetical protein
MLNIVPWVIAQRAFRTVGQFKSLLNEGTPLQSVEQGGIGLQPSNPEEDCSYGGSPEVRKVPACSGQCF